MPYVSHLDVVPNRNYNSAHQPAPPSYGGEMHPHVLQHQPSDPSPSMPPMPQARPPIAFPSALEPAPVLLHLIGLSPVAPSLLLRFALPRRCCLLSLLLSCGLSRPPLTPVGLMVVVVAVDRVCARGWLMAGRRSTPQHGQTSPRPLSAASSPVATPRSPFP